MIIDINDYFKDFDELKAACLNPLISNFSSEEITELKKYEDDAEGFVYKLLGIIIGPTK